MAHLFTSPRSLAACLHEARAPRVLDVRDADDAAADPRRIPGSEPTSLGALHTRDLRAERIVVSCQKGGKLSQLAAAIL
ncbi:MAG: sulfurtransferase, partial [Jannaschia sp.]